MASPKFRWALGALALLASMTAGADPVWPPEQVRIVVPYPPGTEPDVLARDIGNQLAKQTGKVFVVENRPGANAIIGAANVAESAGDGATLLMVDRLALETNPFLYAKVPYDWHADLKPVIDVGRVKLYLAVRENLPVADYKSFIALARSSGKINVGTGGNGHVTHLGMAMLANAEGVNFTYVPYKGVAPAMTALMAGEVDAVMAGGLVMSQQAKTGRIKVLVVGDDRRSDFMPDVPTLQEVGGKPGTIPSTVFSLQAPGKTPDAVVERINAAVRHAMDDKAMRKSYADRGLELVSSSPAETAAQMKEESASYQVLIKQLGVALQ